MSCFFKTLPAVGAIAVFLSTAVADEALLVPPAPATAVLAPPVAVGPFFAYEEPVYVAPVYVAPAYHAPVYVAPVVVQPAAAVPAFGVDWYAPVYIAPARVRVRSSPWSYKAEYEYSTPFGSREVEYRVDRHGRVRIEYDD